MIKVKLIIFFSFKDSLDNGGEISVEVPDKANVKKVLMKVSEKFPEIEPKLLEESGELKRFIQIRLNQSNIERLEGLETRVKEGDELLILPKLGGG
ncbi:MAG: MoaD/ThiS family protein [Candidatus Bipolaricaulia bacterium]